MAVHNRSIPKTAYLHGRRRRAACIVPRLHHLYQNIPVDTVGYRFSSGSGATGSLSDGGPSLVSEFSVCGRSPRSGDFSGRRFDDSTFLMSQPPEEWIIGDKNSPLP